MRRLDAHSLSLQLLICRRYGRWHHLMCWRVPSRIWLGFPKECTDRAVFQHALEGMNEVLLSGVNELTKEQWEVFLEHVMNRENWARLTKRKPRGAAPSEDSIPDQAVSSAQETNIVVQNVRRDVFVPPVPGQNGAAENALEGKTVVLTGVFPEVGGGKGLSLGKARVKKIVQSFGGRVTSAISGKTDIVSQMTLLCCSALESTGTDHISPLLVGGWKEPWVQQGDTSADSRCTTRHVERHEGRTRRRHAGERRNSRYFRVFGWIHEQWHSEDQVGFQGRV